MTIQLEQHQMSFEEIPVESIPGGVPDEIQRVWKSDRFLVRYYMYNGSERLSIDYVLKELNDNVDNIGWQTLQDIKTAIGFGHRTAVELFPSDEQVIPGIAMRHLWLIDKENMGAVGL